jgi:dolichol-phosphate mannosyltransferase
MPLEKILIAIPTYNEKLNIASLSLELLSLYINVDILVIDDNSPDNTERVLTEIQNKFARFKLRTRDSKLGVGSAHIEAFQYAKEKSYNYLITMDADYTHQPEDVLKFIEKRNTADILLGSRFKNKEGVKDWVWYRKIMTIGGHLLTKFLLGIPYDASGAFRCFNLTKVDNSHISLIINKGYGFFIESIFILHKKAHSISEIPIILPKRTYGESKMKVSDVLSTLKLIFKLRIRKLKIFSNFMDEISDIKEEIDDPQDWDTYWRKKKKTPNIIYSILASIYRKLFIKRRLNNVIINNFDEGSEILHAGCGTGQVDGGIAKHMELTSMDISVEALKQYTKTIPNAKEIIRGSIFSTKFRDDTFDGIYNLGVMEHFNKDEIILILNEMKRITKCNGKIILFWPHRYAPSVIILKSITKILNLFYKSFQFHPKEISLLKNRSMIKDLVQASGLELIEYNFGYTDLYIQVCVMLRKNS